MTTLLRQAKQRKALSLDTLMILDAIDTKGSFSAASQQLNRSTSALSYQIQKLEDDLDVLIFDRSKHRAEFTQPGRLLLEKGRLLLLAADEIIQDVCDTANGWELDLSLCYEGIIDPAMFFQLVTDLSEKSRTRLTFKEEILSGGWEALSTGRADILISSMPKVVPVDMKIKKIGQIEMVWIAAPGHPIFQETDPLKDDVRCQYRIIAVSDTARTLPKASRNILSEQTVFTVSSMKDKCNAIRSGLGIGTLPYHMVAQVIEDGEIQQIGKGLTVDIVIAWRRTNMGKAKLWSIKRLEKMWSV